MSTSPATDRPRDPDGRFKAYPLTAVDLALVEPGTEQVWPDLDTDPAEAQDLYYAICWDSRVSEQVRVHAARAAVGVALDHGAENDLPPTEDRDALLDAALHDPETLLDAVHAVGPLPYPQTSEFGARLTGTLYDLYEQRRDEHLHARALDTLYARPVTPAVAPLAERDAYLDALSEDPRQGR